MSFWSFSILPRRSLIAANVEAPALRRSTMPECSLHMTGTGLTVDVELQSLLFLGGMNFIIATIIIALPLMIPVIIMPTNSPLIVFPFIFWRRRSVGHALVDLTRRLGVCCRVPTVSKGVPGGLLLPAGAGNIMLCLDTRNLHVGQNYYEQ